MHLKTKFDYKSIPQNTLFNTRFIISLDAPRGENKNRKPLNISMVLDRSGSMHGEKLEYVKQAAATLVRQLGSSDTISLTSFDDEVTSVIFPGPCSSDNTAESLIAGIQSGGCTNLSGGYQQGIQYAGQGVSDDSISRILLLTDGLANRGIVDPNGIAELVRGALRKGISTTTIGVGLDYNEHLLGLMAENGSGSTYFIENPDDAPGIFNEELGYLFDLAAQNVKVRFSPIIDGISLKQLNTYRVENDGSFSLGDAYGGQEKTLLLELSMPEVKDTGKLNIGTLTVSWDDTSGEKMSHETRDIEISINVVSESEFARVVPDVDVTLQAAFLTISRAKNESIQLADQGRFTEAAELLEDYAQMMEALNLVDARLHDEVMNLRDRARNLREYGVDFYTPKEKKRMYYEKEMMLKSKMASYDSMISRRKD
jgi:Ca-activated chloride channel family protein